jgi:hypothetical protein
VFMIQPSFLSQNVVQWGQHVWILVGALALGSVGLVVGIALWTGIKILRDTKEKRRAQEEYRKSFYTADGRPYPPFIEGQCERCGRGNRKIYHPETGQKLCPECFESFRPNVLPSETKR